MNPGVGVADWLIALQTPPPAPGYSPASPTYNDAPPTYNDAVLPPTPSPSPTLLSSAGENLILIALDRIIDLLASILAVLQQH